MCSKTIKRTAATITTTKATTTAAIETITILKLCPEILVQIQSVDKHSQRGKRQYFVPKDHLQH